MTEQSRKLLDKADRAVHAAETLLREGDSDFAVGRAYYAMFYAAEALLIKKVSAFASTAASTLHSASTLPRAMCSIPNTIAGCWMPMISESSAIMVWRLR